MNILVLGHTGFMGKNIMETLRSYFGPNHNISGCSTNERRTNGPHGLRNANFDLTTKHGVEDALGKTKWDVVIQAAATTSGAEDIVNKPYLHVTDNAVMNSLILRACHDHGIKNFMFLSCGVMYQSGGTRKESDFNESDEIYPNYFGVGWTKVYIEKQMEFYSRLGMNCLAIRHSNTFGKYDKFDSSKSHFVAATVSKIGRAKDGDTITVWGTGEERRDLIFVDDVCSFIIDRCELIEDDGVIDGSIRPLSFGLDRSPFFDVVNVSAGQSYAVNDVVQKLIDYSGKKLVIAHDTTKPSIKFDLALDNTKAEIDYEWTPIFNLESALKLTYDWYVNKMGLTI